MPKDFTPEQQAVINANKAAYDKLMDLKEEVFMLGKPNVIQSVANEKTLRKASPETLEALLTNDVYALLNCRAKSTKGKGTDTLKALLTWDVNKIASLSAEGTRRLHWLSSSERRGEKIIKFAELEKMYDSWGKEKFDAVMIEVNSDLKAKGERGRPQNREETLELLNKHALKHGVYYNGKKATKADSFSNPAYGQQSHSANAGDGNSVTDGFDEPEILNDADTTKLLPPQRGREQ